MNKDERRATKAEFNRYKAEIERLIKKLGFGDWEYRVIFETPSNPNLRASFECNDAHTFAYFYYNPLQYKPADGPGRVEKTARHEIAHMITSRLDMLAHTRFCSPDEIALEMEKIATILQNVL